jgi:hypothetical protein
MLKEYGNEQFKDQVMKSMGYSNIVSLLSYSESVELPALQLLTSLIEGNSRNQD